MISKLEGKRIHMVFEIGEYNPKIIDYLTLLDITSRSKASDRAIETLSEEIKDNWWKENKASFLGESGN